MEPVESPPPRRWWKLVALVLGLALFLVSRSVCIRAFLMSGILVDRCPDGDIVQTFFIETSGLRRGTGGWVRFGAEAHYTTGAPDAIASAWVRRVSGKLALVKPSGEEVPLQPKASLRDDATGRSATVELPDVPDGEYLLRAHVSTPIGDGVAEVALPVFAPARVHVLTDRPIYEPGNTVQFRALVLRAKDFAPLDGRPGRVEVRDPTGEVMLEEKVAAGEFGVASGAFPLDLGAAVGDWTLRWVSGPAEDTVKFRVEPFALPRFSVEASSVKAFYSAQEVPVVRGRVRYSSGAPVRDAALEITWSVLGAWPPPSEWIARELPQSVVADASGAFELRLPRVPKDLRGRATLLGRITATDAAQDRVEGSVAVVLAEDRIEVSAVTELDGGLVQGFNNRVYLRATTADGAVLRETRIVVRRAWDPKDRGIEATTDVDGVAALQLDPGPPVNVVVPPMPIRPPPRPPAIRRTGVEELVGGHAPSLTDLRAMDAWNAPLEACARFVDQGSAGAQVVLRADASGLLDAVVAAQAPVERCLTEVLRGRRLPAGATRLYRLSFEVSSDLPRIGVRVTGAPEVPDALDRAIREAALDARSCLDDVTEPQPLPRMLLFSRATGASAVDLRFAADPEVESSLSSAVTTCIEGKLIHVALPNAAATSEPRAGALGIARFIVEPRRSIAQERPIAMTRLGYELLVEAWAGTEAIGKTKLFVAPGQVPDVRLRPSKVLAEPGDEVEIAILRGPNFRGQIPEKLYLSHARGAIEGAVDPKLRVARFHVPDDGQGWFSCNLGGTRALIYVRPKGELEVFVRARQEVYAPGDRAILDVTTKSGGVAARAGVGLFGVDLSLAQLAALLGPDELARVRPHAAMRAPAFGVLDATALELGRVRGAGAAQAIVLQVSSLPATVELDTPVQVASHPSFDPIEALTDHFYPVLAELHEQVRAWEEKAPKGESMSPSKMARLWDQALADAEAKKLSVNDAFGRKLRLHRLPDDLLALTDPRAVVVDGTRLPEDVENWAEWVKKERP